MHKYTHTWILLNRCDRDVCVRNENDDRDGCGVRGCLFFNSLKRLWTRQYYVICSTIYSKLEYIYSCISVYASIRSAGTSSGHFLVGRRATGRWTFKLRVHPCTLFTTIEITLYYIILYYGRCENKEKTTKTIARDAGTVLCFFVNCIRFLSISLTNKTVILFQTIHCHYYFI